MTTVPDAPPLPADLERLLIVSPSWVGDTVMASCVLRAVRSERPGARIAIALRANLADLLRGCPWVDEVVPLAMGGLAGPFRAALGLHRLRPQAALLLPNSFRSALTVCLAGAPIRVGYARDGRGALLSRRLAVEKTAEPTPTVAYYARLAAFSLGVDGIDTRPELFVTAEEEASADRLLEDVDGPFAALAPGANRTDKRWPAERFARVADALHETHGLRSVVCGSPPERAVAKAVTTAARAPITDLAARGLTLGSLKAVLRRAALLITNDTGPRHVAAALGTPVVSLFGPTDHRWTSLPGVREHILLAEPFLPAELIADRHAKRCAIERIAMGDVIEAAERMLEEGD